MGSVTTKRDLVCFIKQYGTEWVHIKLGTTHYSIQVTVASFSKGKLCPGGSSTNKVWLKFSDDLSKDAFSVNDGDLFWPVKRPRMDEGLMLLLVIDCEDNRSRVIARPNKYKMGQVLYDIVANRTGRIEGFWPNTPQNYTSYCGRPHPRYVVKGRLFDLEVPVSEEDIAHHLIVDAKHEAAAASRIVVWLRALRYNAIIRGALVTARREGAFTKFIQTCRAGSVGEVEGYLKLHAFDLSKPSHLTKKTPLREATEHFNDEVVMFLVGKGVDPNKKDDHGYVLDSCLRSTEAGSLRTTRTLLSLMETQADPNGETGSSDARASSDGKRYWLNVNRARPRYRREDMDRMKVPHLARFYFALVGQPYARQTVVSEISNILSNQEKYRRMVFVLGGPPGHGKTMTGKELCQALGGASPEDDFLKISCPNVNSLVELFGSSGAYKSSGVGSELNNFVVSHRSKIGVVNLDEFDRLDPEVRDGLFTIFDKGEWVDKKTDFKKQTKTLDCRKIVWILTTNVFDNEIIDFYNKEKKTFDDKRPNPRKWRQIDRKIKWSFKQSIESVFGEAMARRLGSLIPFVPFTQEECVAFVEHEIEEWRMSYAKPPNPNAEPVRLVGNFNFTVDPEVVKFIAKHYDKSQGATSIKDFLEKEIVSEINRAYLEGCEMGGTAGRFYLTGEPGEEGIEFDF